MTVVSAPVRSQFLILLQVELNFIFYAPNFKKSKEAYCFWLVRSLSFIRLLHFLVHSLFRTMYANVLEISYMDSS